MGHRRRGREYAVQALFQIDLTGDGPLDVFERFWSGIDAKPEVRRFAENLVSTVIDNRDEIDRRIVESARNWRLERMAAVDRNTLRVAVCEMLHDRGTPIPVVLDEAIEIAKRFGGEDSGSFVNGVLDHIRRDLERERTSSPPEEAAPR